MYRKVKQKQLISLGGDKVYHIIIEQTQEYKNRMKYNPATNSFIDAGYLSLGHVRSFTYPYGWIKESGTPPEPHLDVILLSPEKYKLGDERAVKIVGCFVRNDGDNKLIGILPERLETDFYDLPENEKADLYRMYPRVGEGEGWYGIVKTKEVIDDFFRNKK